MVHMLNDNTIQYHTLIGDIFYVEDPRTGKKILAQHIFSNIKIKAISLA